MQVLNMTTTNRTGGGIVGGVVRQGYLRKLKTMKRKYFVLRAETAEDSARLEYYESEKKHRAGLPPRRTISLKFCFDINRRLDLKQRHVIALYLKEECFCIVPDDEDELSLWLADLLRLQHVDDGSDELLHPTQHVWQVNVQKKGLGASKNILGLYNLCLTDKTLTLVKIKANNIMYDSCIPDRVEFSLWNIRRCGDSECFFYMEVGRQTATGAGELWMHTDDANIAKSMHSTILHAMSNCTKAKEDQVQPIRRDRCASFTDGSRPVLLPQRRQTYSDSKGRAGLSPTIANNDNQLLNNSLIHQKESSGSALEKSPKMGCSIKHHRTVSLPTGCALFQEPLKIVHERTRSAPLTGDELDCAVIEKAPRHASCKAVNGIDSSLTKKQGQWSRRASTGTRLSKWSPAHVKNTTGIRSRCDSMPSRACPRETEQDRTPVLYVPDLVDGGDSSRDEPDSVDWHRTPRIPEEPDAAYCEMKPASRDIQRTTHMTSSVQHSRTSSLVEEVSPPDGYLRMGPGHARGDSGYVDVQRALSPAASSGSVCSGTPSTDPRFSEYQLEPATSHILSEEEERPPRAYSVGSRPTQARTPQDVARMRAYSVGARTRTRPAFISTHHAPGGKTSSEPTLPPRASIEDLMMLDFSNNSPRAKIVKAHTPPASGFIAPSRVTISRFTPKAKVDEYVNMSPTGGRSDGYVEMRPTDSGFAASVSDYSTTGRVITPKSPPSTVATTPDGYVEMNYGSKRLERDCTPSRPITILSNLITERPRTSTTTNERSVSQSSTPMVSPQTPSQSEVSNDLRSKKRNGRDHYKDVTPISSQTIFPLSLESPVSPLRASSGDGDRNELEATDVFDDDMPHYPLTTVREISEEGGRKSPEIGLPPDYVMLIRSRNASKPIAAPAKLSSESDADELSCNPTATKMLACAGENVNTVNVTLVKAGSVVAPARFTVGEESSRKSSSPGPCDVASQLNYASLDLEPKTGAAAAAPRTYTQIDFIRSEKLNTADAN